MFHSWSWFQSESISGQFFDLGFSISRLVVGRPCIPAMTRNPDFAVSTLVLVWKWYSQVGCLIGWFMLVPIPFSATAWWKPHLFNDAWRCWPWMTMVKWLSCNDCRLSPQSGGCCCGSDSWFCHSAGSTWRWMPYDNVSDWRVYPGIPVLVQYHVRSWGPVLVCFRASWTKLVIQARWSYTFWLVIVDTTSYNMASKNNNTSWTTKLYINTSKVLLYTSCKRI